MVLVKPATVVQWHRQGFRLFWRWRSRSGRPSVDRETRDLVRQISSANPLWGAPRIHGELLKLGLEISQATVAKYMVRRRGKPSPTWRSFLRNQAQGIAAIDMFVVACASFRLLYVAIILGHDRRTIQHTAVTEHPTAAWLSRQVTEAFPWDTAPRYLLRDRDGSYGAEFCTRVEAMGITEVVTAPRAPWQNAYVERVIGSIRRECLDHIVIFNERHLRRVLSSYVDYYQRTRTHLSLDKDCPDPRPIMPPQVRKSRRDPASRRFALPLRTSRRLIRHRLLLTNSQAAARKPSSEDLSIGGFSISIRESAACGLDRCPSHLAVNSIAIRGRSMSGSDGIPSRDNGSLLGSPATSSDDKPPTGPVSCRSHVLSFFLSLVREDRSDFAVDLVGEPPKCGTS
jgi:transposase InsO family protein